MAGNLIKRYDSPETSPVRRPNLRENLELQLQQAQAEVKRLAEALQLLDQNPDTTRILELLGHW